VQKKWLNASIAAPHQRGRDGHPPACETAKIASGSDSAHRRLISCTILSFDRVAYRRTLISDAIVRRMRVAGRFAARCQVYRHSARDLRLCRCCALAAEDVVIAQNPKMARMPPPLAEKPRRFQSAFLVMPALGTCTAMLSEAIRRPSRGEDHLQSALSIAWPAGH